MCAWFITEFRYCFFKVFYAIVYSINTFLLNSSKMNLLRNTLQSIGANFSYGANFSCFNEVINYILLWV